VAAIKETAAPLIELFAADAGKFVWATAGLHLKSLLAAHGSGAAALSREPEQTALNVDVGGTPKFAVWRKATWTRQRRSTWGHVLWHGTRGAGRALVLIRIRPGHLDCVSAQAGRR
jgi:hypothetical protein